MAPNQDQPLQGTLHEHQRGRPHEGEVVIGPLEPLIRHFVLGQQDGQGFPDPHEVAEALQGIGTKLDRPCSGLFLPGEERAADRQAQQAELLAFREPPGPGDPEEGPEPRPAEVFRGRHRGFRNVGLEVGHGQLLASG